MKCSLVALTLLVGAGLAHGQTIGFTTVGRGTTGPLGPARNTVVKTAAELQSSGVRPLLRPGTQVDLQSEMLIAVRMGTQNTGGYSIEVKSVVRRPLPSVPGAPVAYALDVTVERRSPAPGTMVTMALTSPYHVVKLRRYARDQVRFVAPAPGPVFAVVERDISSYDQGVTVRIERATGKVVVQRHQINALIAPVEGTATAAELAALAAALRSNDFKGLPASLPMPDPVPQDYPGMSLRVTGGSQAHAVTGLAGMHGVYEARVSAINAAIDAIADRVGTTASLPTVGLTGSVPGQ